MRLNAATAFVLFLTVPFGIPLSAQVFYGSIVGAVTDSSGGSVPGATVTITNHATGESRDVKTDSAGRYTFSDASPGTYDIKVNASGFRTAEQTGVTVSINTVTRNDLVLEVGQVTEAVTVQAAALALQADKADVHTDLTEKAIENLPMSNYRNYQSLIDLVPGATPAAFQNANTDTPARALTTNINGTNRNNNATKLDGAVNVFIWLPHHTVYVPPAETIETVNISTNNFDADQGMAGGAAITVITKSGTNELHGSAFGYLENSYFGTKNYFFTDPKKPKSIRTIPGFTLGGPLRKNHWFFFGGYEGLFERQNRNAFFTLPTADQMAGNFSATGAVIYDPTTGNPDGTGRTAFAGDQIPANRISPIAQKVQALLPTPNEPGFANNYFNSASQRMNRKNVDFKTDIVPTDKWRIFARYGYMQADVSGVFGLGAAGGDCLCDGGPGTGDTSVNLATVGYTYSFSPTRLYDATYGFTRMGHISHGNDFGKNWGSDVFGIPGTNGPDPRESGLPFFNISGYSPIGNDQSWIPAFRNDQSFATSQNFSIVHGSHEFRMGFDGVRHHLNHWQPELGAGPRGELDFGEGLTALNDPNYVTTQFNAYAAFLLGYTSSVGRSIQYEKMTTYELQMGWYFRDRWQVTPKLTATLGVRYELYPLMTRAGRGGIEEYDPTTNIVTLGGAGGLPKDLGVTTSKKMFSPRIGLAYRLNDTTVIRTGYGITRDPMPLSRPLRGFYPLTVGETFSQANSYVPYDTMAQGIPPVVGPDESTGKVVLPGSADMRFITDGHLRRGYIQSWNFIVEKQLPGSTVVSAGYVGTSTVDAFADWNGNAAAPGTGQAGQPLFQKFGRTSETLFWNGFVGANYHSLQVSFARRMASGLTLQGAYTYSHAIDYTDDDGWTGLMFNYAPDLGRNRATSGFDRTHNFHVGYVYEFPFGKGKKYATSGVPAVILGGWQANGIVAIYSGAPFTVSADGTALNAPGNSQTADQVGPVHKIGTLQEYYDVSAFAPVTTARFGTSGRNILRGPGVINNDLSLFRDFMLTERWKMTFKAEAFNLTNTPHFGSPDSNVNDAAFMTISGSAGTLSDNRSIRFGLRVGW
ncbi:MAG TPA: TonB-dependent receptor [Bryobacteraceae bacterium]|nr:TonB-dependent receptor [Bryobacteraceae bacterium]